MIESPSLVQPLNAKPTTPSHARYEDISPVESDFDSQSDTDFGEWSYGDGIRPSLFEFKACLCRSCWKQPAAQLANNAGKQ
ncbi:hypothetical protein AJ79_00118 [Helicocarpus griseus UAMH5409]|uniref:Uncharacterized protein n=1 Tax=Helicocarpus griseus UAMH5409 TaxID=1447875 RepID=A0A2B7Y4L8_9EURO|nr:hypothetical protein AJ79_00118 [Helicocarpus griseus UAMH5409]